MEINAINVTRHKLSRGKPSFNRKEKMDEESRFAIYGRNTENDGQFRPSDKKKSCKEFEIGLLSGTYTLPFLAKLQFDHRDFTHSRRLCNKNNVYLKRMAC